MRMRWGWSGVAVAVVAVAALAADQPQSVLVLPCTQSAAGIATCNPSKNELKQARTDFSKGVRFRKAGHIDRAFEFFDSAARLDPHNIDYVTALEMSRQQLVFDHVQRGNADLLQEKKVEAQAEFRAALDLDPQNQFAQQRLQDSLAEWQPKITGGVQLLQDSGILRVIPNSMKHGFHFRGDGRDLLTQIAAAFGVTVEFDEKVVTHRVHFDIEPVDFFTAMRAACNVTHTFWTPLAEKQILLAAESLDNHRLFDRMALRTFRIPGATTQSEQAEVLNMLRTIFEIRFVVSQPLEGTITIRAPVNVLDAATKVLDGLGEGRPQVLLDIRVYQISHNLTRNMGVHIPNQFNLFNIPAGALAALGGQNIGDLINQLISGGGINQASSQGIAGLLAQLQGQQNSIFSQPLATFGNGLTLMGLSLDSLSAQLSMNESWVKDLQHATLRAGHNSEATYLIGERYPILNASFAPVFNSAAISQVLQNNSFQAPFPSFNYEDLGLSLKAKPIISGNGDVNLTLEMQLRTLAGPSINGVPVISNREYKGSITLTDGEPAVVAGAISRNEQLSLGGIPGLGAVPGLNKVMVTNTKTEDDDELLVVVTPHVVRHDLHEQSSEVWMPR